ARLCPRHACFFFFSSRRRHTRSKRDWSSDVCSSDLWRCRRGTPTMPPPRGSGWTRLPMTARRRRACVLAPKRCRPCCRQLRKARSEERRVGKEWRARGAPEGDKTKVGEGVGGEAGPL